VPAIAFDDAELNVVVLLVDEKLVVCPRWRSAVVSLANDLNAERYHSAKQNTAESKSILIPAAMHDSFYRTGPLYEGFNPVRLLDMDATAMESTLRRAATEATARALRGEGFQNPSPLDVFLSHAKRDGQTIAQSIRDGVRNFGQLVAWFDANDLPYGAAWESPKGTLVWKVQPVVAVHQPGTGWVRGVPMLEGVPRIGWNPDETSDMTRRIVDRLVLEVMLGHVHRCTSS